MAQVLERDNLLQALKQVVRNKGAAGVDGMTVEELPEYLKHHWLDIKAGLEVGHYRPQPAQRVEIPKAGGKKRKLGIPTVIDRLIQQAIAQILSQRWEPQFHPNSYGFRPLGSAQMAVKYAQSEINNGKKWVVDLDLEAFFDRVNHDKLMDTLKEEIKDKPLLRLINSYLKADIEINGQYEKTTEGVPQGSPLSPLLSDIVLNALDWELERRGHTFVRYADDCQIYVSSQRKRKFLGFTFSPRRGHKLKVSEAALEKLKHAVRGLCRRTRGKSIYQIIAELRKALLGWTDFRSCKICIHTIHGSQSLFRYSRSKESVTRYR